MRSKAFRYLWVGQSFANAGDVLYIVALIAALYDLTNSALQMTLVPFIITLSRFISSVIAPILLDRYTLKYLLATAQAVKTFFMFCLFLAVLSHIPYTGILFILAALIAFLDGWALPATNALVPSLVKREELMKTNGFLSTMEQSIQFAGWAAGGVLTAFIHPAFTIAISTGFYVLSTIFMYSIPYYRDKMNQEKYDNRFRIYLEQLSSGWKEIWNHSILLHIQLVNWLETIADVVWIAAIMYLFVNQQLHVGEEWWGYINGAFIIGLLIASVLLIKLHSVYHTQRRRVLMICSFGAACATLLFGLNTFPIYALLFSLLFGLFDQQKAVLLQTFIQMKVESDKLPKVYAAQGAITALTFGIASLLAGIVVEKIGVQNIYLIASLLLLISLVPLYFVRKKL